MEAGLPARLHVDRRLWFPVLRIRDPRPEIQRETGWRTEIVFGAFSWSLLAAGLIGLGLGHSLAVAALIGLDLSAAWLLGCFVAASNAKRRESEVTV